MTCKFCKIGEKKRQLMYRLVGNLSVEQLKKLIKEFISRGLIPPHLLKDKNRKRSSKRKEWIWK